MIYTNQENIPLSLALWLAHDPYVVHPDPNSFSATSILKPLRSIVLSARMPLAPSTDIASRIAARLGQAIHDSVESSWLLGADVREELLKSIGLPSGARSRILINPGNIEMDDDVIPIYTEKRFERKLDQWLMTGTADFIVNGQLEDFKSTKCYAYQKQSSAEKFIQQGSIYRWMDPAVITEDHLVINYIFLDWMASKKKWEKNYPSSQILTQKYPLMSLIETENFIRRKLTAIAQNMQLPQEQLPLCSREELWQDNSVFKYYKNPNATKRSTKNFDNGFAADNHRIKMGVGIVKEVPGKAIFCRYCPAVTVCTQAENLIAADLLDL